MHSLLFIFAHLFRYGTNNVYRLRKTTFGRCGNRPSANSGRRPDTVESSSLLEFIVKYTQTENVERIVIGMPMQTNGQLSENAARVRSFAGRLKKAIDIPVEFYDERFTSVLAHKTILSSGLHKMARRDKALVDKVSATIILQSYMESRK